MKKLNIKKIKPKKKLVVKEKPLKKVKPKKIKEEKEKKKKKLNINKKKILNIVLIMFISLCILAIISAGSFFWYIAKNAPKFNEALLYEKESSLIYDSTGVLRATLGIEKREKLTYDELPEVLVDAIIATEDSRYFQHNGFDFPRFLKASLGQLLGKSESGGASTITMQISKLAFTDTTSEGLKGIIRKFTDIYMSIFKIEKNYTKEEILEFYINTPFMGPGAYGVEQASQKYFGKKAADLTLTEAALIAGLFQAPNSYNPFVDPEAATERRDQVLYLMERHGYITKDQRKAASAISIESLIVNNTNAESNPYKGFVETVIAEVESRTGNSPYNVPMIIHSTLDPAKQDVINSIYNGGFTFKDDVIQFASAVIDNNTGSILAVGTGRDRASGEMLFNYAASPEMKRHPGSTAKPIFDYGPGFEFQKWSTYTPFFDESNTTYSGGGVMNNSSGGFSGFSTLRTCLVNSINTCALQAFQRLEKENIYSFVTGLGIQPEGEEYGGLHEAHSIGAFSGVNPVQLAAAYSAFGNGGYYIEPHSVNKIEYRDSDEVWEYEVVKKKAMSEQTAYMITNVLMGATPWTVRVSGTQVATKTGTSSYDDKTLRDLGLSRAIIQDSWVASYSPDVSIVMWLGYDKLTKEYNITQSRASTDRITLIGLLCNGIMPTGSKFTSPGGIVSSRVETGTIPAMLPSDYTPSDLIQSHLFISGTEPAETSFRFSQLSNPTEIKYSINESNMLSVNWTSPGIPTAIDTNYLSGYFANGYGKWAEKYLNQRITYNNNYIGTFGFEVYLKTGNTEKYIGYTDKTSYEINLNDYTGYDTVLIKSTYTIFKNNKSSGASKKFSDEDLSNIKFTLTLKDVTLTKGESWSGSKKEDVKVSGISSGYNISIVGPDTILDSDKKSVALNDLTNKAGHYTAEYQVKLEYLGYTYDSKKVIQNIIVKDETSSTTTP